MGERDPYPVQEGLPGFPHPSSPVFFSPHPSVPCPVWGEKSRVPGSGWRPVLCRGGAGGGVYIAFHLLVDFLDPLP